MSPIPPDTVFVVNRRYMPAHVGAEYPYGVVQHALQAAALISRAGARVGFILYEHDENATAPELRHTLVVGRYPAVVVPYPVRMGQTLTTALRTAISAVSTGRRGRDGPVLYLQTSILLPFLDTDGLDVLLTHHAPFVADVRAAVGADAARRAFDWDHPKTSFLAEWQERAVERTVADPRVRCAEISAIQEAHLRRAGVPEQRLSRIPPPVAVDGAHHVPDGALAAAARRDGRVAVTAVSRLDYFKNIELFLRGCVLALGDGVLDHALVVGGPPDDVERVRLTRLVPRRWREAVTLLPRHPRSVVAGWLFEQLAGRGAFACTSRFDLVPYTALEAARTGLATMTPDTGWVGAAEYLPARYQFRPEPLQLAAALAEVLGNYATAAAFAPIARRIAAATSDEAFLDAYGRACAEF